MNLESDWTKIKSVETLQYMLFLYQDQLGEFIVKRQQGRKKRTVRIKDYAVANIVFDSYLAELTERLEH